MKTLIIFSSAVALGGIAYLLLRKKGLQPARIRIEARKIR